MSWWYSTIKAAIECQTMNITTKLQHIPSFFLFFSVKNPSNNFQCFKSHHKLTKHILTIPNLSKQIVSLMKNNRFSFNFSKKKYAIAVAILVMIRKIYDVWSCNFHKIHCEIGNQAILQVITRKMYYTRKSWMNPWLYWIAAIWNSLCFHRSNVRIRIVLWHLIFYNVWNLH